MDDYKRQFKTPGNQNWLKGAVAVNISKHGLAPFACKVVDHLRVETIKTQLSLDICENCSLPETIPCDLKNGICNEGYCTFHQGRSFHPCPILKCNDFRNDCLVKIDKGIPLGVTCNGCSTAEIVPCIQGNQVCRYSCGICKFHNDPKTNVPIKHRPCPKNICDALFDAIEINHRFGNPSWRNTDVRKMCFNSWHIAKCYMPREGYAHVENEESTDLNGIINVYINCKTFQNYFNADLSQLQNVCTKVREVGKQLRHATGLEVEEDVLKDWMYDLKNVFNDPIFLGVNQYAQFALDQLTKLEKDQIHIEQSDVVAAIDGITNSLKTILCNNEDLSENLREIKDNLKDLERLKRDILDEIKDETKRQQHNIRVKLLKSLLDFHKKNNSTLTLGPFFEIQDSRLEDFYVPPSLVKMCSSSTSVDDGLFEDTTETFTSLMQLLNPDNDIKQFIYITADAGAGTGDFIT
ncbi:hypothetical protein MAR_036968 [Mya arenaria]|uniref:Uncharacterized protein n=1 Tax=Mya arenaria TaxID=6604 RepID=A0ABY7FR15_MYAAR|nr:hypothetical protein MAR_036968 [Mya arenaria]